MTPATKAVLSGSGLVAVSVMLAFAALLVAAVTAGKSIAGGERAAVITGVIELVLGLGAIIAFWMLNGALRLVPRVLGTLCFAAVELTALAFVFLFALVLLNR